jgi:hypothetical protein
VDDRGSVAPARLVLIVAATTVVCSLPGRAAPQAAADVRSLVTRVGERVASYYRRAQTIVCLETSTVQPIRANWELAGMARTVVSELRVEPDATVRREVRRINGREPRERDKKDSSGCTDPNPLSPEPLAFLLPDGHEEYIFTGVREGRDRGRPALVIDFASANRRSRAELIEDKLGRDSCFSVDGDIAIRGQVWVDANTHDVLRLENHTAGPVDARISWTLQRRYNFDAFTTLDRHDETIRYKDVTFTDPSEVVVLPESIESTTTWRGTLQSTRRTTTFTDYRRFLTAGRVR